MTKFLSKIKKVLMKKWWIFTKNNNTLIIKSLHFFQSIIHPKCLQNWWGFQKVWGVVGGGTGTTALPSLYKNYFWTIIIWTFVDNFAPNSFYFIVQFSYFNEAVILRYIVEFIIYYLYINHQQKWPLLVKNH